ncbi:MAG TPA: hypothetical protein VMR37_07580 [Rhabdochlamydiaceae bacterium]|jgi:DNA-binding transcriptional regulator YiaG|nr:hypothetical protein [Rhabdochlamydiaceae bacterium]
MIDTPALLEETKGSNWFLLRTKEGPIRTSSQIPAQVKITLNQSTAVYQKLAPKIKELKALGMSQEVIANKLDVNVKTIRKGALFNN